MRSANRRVTDEQVALIQRCARLRRAVPSLRELAEATGLSVSHVGHISNGSAVPKSSDSAVVHDCLRPVVRGL